MIIGITGLIGSGKGTVADILVEQHGFVKLSFADSLKDVVSIVFQWPRELLEGDTDQSREWREQVDTWWSNRLGMPGLTPRLVLQKWGTEVCRDSWHRDIWIASMERKIHEAILTTAENYTHPKIVIPDTRFPNEVDMIQRMNGQVWWIRRGENPEWFDVYRSHKIIPTDIHASEWAWANSNFDKIIENNFTKEHLKQTIENLI